MTIEKIWQRYTSLRSKQRKTEKEQREYTEVRNKLIEEYEEIVDPIIDRKFPQGRIGIFSREDLRQICILGLVDALERFDPTRNVAFQSYARRRIRYFLIDTLREADWVPNYYRKRIKKIQRIEEDFQKQHGYSPNDEELHGELVEKRQIEPKLAIRMVDSRFLFNDCSANISDDKADQYPHQDGLPLSHACRQDFRNFLTTGLLEEEKKVLCSVYFEGQSIEKTAEETGIGKFTIWNRLRTAKSKIRVKLQLSGLMISDELEEFR